MAVLYRKYRPQSFSEVLGHKPIVKTLLNQVATSQVAHAYLFTGVRGTGKTSIARLLAKAVNCEKLSGAGVKKKAAHAEEGEPCGVCENCKAIAGGNFLDLVEIDAASNTGVDNIRDLIEHVKFSPSKGRYKVFIIDEVHMLSKGAFNALLKTLEEPPAHALFILATTEIHKVPATIISRTQRFDFKRFSRQELQEFLAGIAKKEKLKIASDVLELVAENADGSARDALSLLDKLLTLGADPGLEESQQLLGVTDIASCEELLQLISEGQSQALPDFFSGVLSRGLDPVIFNKDFLEYLRKCLVWKIHGGGLALEETSQKRLEKLATGFSAQELMFVVRLFLKSYKEIPETPDPVLPLLLAGLEAALKREIKPAAESMQQLASPASHASAKPSVVAPSLAVSEVLEGSFKQVKNESFEAPVEPVAASFDVTITGEQVQLFWPSVINSVKQVNSPLANLLRSASLLGVENGRIVLGVKYAFDKQNLESPKNQTTVLEWIEKTSGKRLGLMARMVKVEERPLKPATEVLGEALKIFGGELVE